MLKITSRPKKRLFLFLILLSLLLVCFAVYGIWVVSAPGLSDIGGFLPSLAGWLLGGVCLVLAVGVICVFLAIIGVPVAGILQRSAWSAVNLLFPLAVIVGRICKVDKEWTERSFIEVSNRLVRQKGLNIKPEKLLILTPHCIQQDTCPHKITREALNCRRCGACQVGELLDVAQGCGAKLAVVTGGTLARKKIKEIRPQAVLAIACERDLTSGIQEVFPLPVIGVLNERPCGPCCNTRVDMESVKREIENFCGIKIK